MLSKKIDLREDTEIVSNDVIEVLFATEHKDIKVPSKLNEDMGYDVYPYFNDESIFIDVGETVPVPTGLYYRLPDTHGFIAKERGSTGTIGMRVGAGILDSDYQGEIFIAINNTNKVPIAITKTVDKVVKLEHCILYPYSKAIAQLILVKVPKTKIKKISLKELKAMPSKRKDGKLGSSGK